MRRTTNSVRIDLDLTLVFTLCFLGWLNSIRESNINANFSIDKTNKKYTADQRPDVQCSTIIHYTMYAMNFTQILYEVGEWIIMNSLIFFDLYLCHIYFEKPMFWVSSERFFFLLISSLIRSQKKKRKKSREKLVHSPPSVVTFVSAIICMIFVLSIYFCCCFFFFFSLSHSVPFSLVFVFLFGF